MYRMYENPKTQGKSNALGIKLTLYCDTRYQGEYCALERSRNDF